MELIVLDNFTTTDKQYFLVEYEVLSCPESDSDIRFKIFHCTHDRLKAKINQLCEEKRSIENYIERDSATLKKVYLLKG